MSKFLQLYRRWHYGIHTMQIGIYAKYVLVITYPLHEVTIATLTTQFLKAMKNLNSLKTHPRISKINILTLKYFRWIQDSSRRVEVGWPCDHRRWLPLKRGLGASSDETKIKHKQLNVKWCIFRPQLKHCKVHKYDLTYGYLKKEWWLHHKCTDC